MVKTDYVSLHNHTTFSLMNSLIRPDSLFERAKELGQSAIAVTDYATLAGAWDCLKASAKHGVKVIMGCEFNFVDDLSESSKLRHVVLLAKNHEGYKNLLLANKLANDNNIILFNKAVPRIDWNILEQCSSGLICITAGGGGILSRLINTRQLDEAKKQAKRLQNIFGDSLGLEIQPHAMKRNASPYNDYEDQFHVNTRLIELGDELGIKIVAATDAHYLNKDDWEMHDALLSIGTGVPVRAKARPRYSAHEFYVKSRQEVHSFFARHYDERADEFCDNSLYFSDMCEDPKWINPKETNPSGKELPSFPVADQKDYDNFKSWFNSKVYDSDPEIKPDMPEDVAYLRYWCDKGFKEKVPQGKEAEYLERLKEEFDVIEYHGFSSYMLIVADYIQFCKENNISVGPGRGCLEGNTNVLTSAGFKKLQEVDIGDKVYTHTGKLKEVTNKFKYDVDEVGTEIFTEFSTSPIVMTSNHKVYGIKSEETEQYIRLERLGLKSLNKVRRWKKQDGPQWFPISELSVNDKIFMPSICRNIEGEYDIDDDFLYLLGRWVGDGWFYYHKKLGYQVGIAHHSDDKEGINRITEILRSKGLNVSHFKHNSNKLIQCKVHNKPFQDLLKSFFTEYKQASKTKHLPIFFRQLSNRQLKVLLSGLIDADGHIEFGRRHIKRENIDTTSIRLALEIKEALLFLGIPSSINEREPFFRGKYACNRSYKIRFKGISLEKSINNNLDNGYFCKITKLNNKNINKVFDISVEGDRSYLTSNYAVHNSVGGSLIGYLTGIHKADPIKYDLIFARFHNKSKTSFPDIDTDFAPSGRYLVQKYIVDKYGEDHVAHVSNVNTMTPKVYARDIARSFQFGGDRKKAVEIGTAIADSIPIEIKTVQKALERAPFFGEYAENAKYAPLKKFAGLGGIEKVWSTHAGGLVISNRPLVEFVPVRRDKEGNPAIEYEKNRAEDNGLVKMDTLGLETLDIIDNTYKLIKINGKSPPPYDLDYDKYDEKTYDLFASGNTMCVFQLGSSAGTIDLCKKVKPKNIEDIAIINSLARPSARDIRQDFVKTKDGEKPVELLHPSLKRAFEPTYGFGLYEECLMYLAQDVAGWTLHEADGLRKLTKEKGKNPKKAAQLKKDFIDGAIRNSISKKMGTDIWNKVVDKFQGYGFNKPHAIFYSMLGFHTAYLKAHFPLEFLVANLMSEVNSNAKISADNINKIKGEIRKMGVKILPPNINRSEKTYTIVDDNTLVTGLDSLKYMGKDAIPEITKYRPFSSFEDLLRKVDGRKVRITSIQALAASGCLDQFGLTRKQMFLYASDYKKKLQVWSKKKGDIPFEYPWPDDIGEWTLSEQFALESYYIGEGLCCSMREAYPGFFDNRALDFSKLSEIFPEDSSGDKFFIPAQIGTVEGVINNIFEFKVKKETSKIFGQTMAKADIEDPYGNTTSMTMFPSGLERINSRLQALTRGKIQFEPGIGIHCAASINWYEGGASLIFEDLKKAAPIPPLPSDLKARKVSMRISAVKARKKSDKLDPDKFLEQVEDELVEEGYSDIN